MVGCYIWYSKGHHRCTKYTNPAINGQCTTVSPYNGPSLCGVNVPINGLNLTSFRHLAQRVSCHRRRQSRRCWRSGWRSRERSRCGSSCWKTRRKQRRRKYIIHLVTKIIVTVLISKAVLPALEIWTSSSAVEDRPRDASCLSVSFNSTIRRAQTSIISRTSSSGLPLRNLNLFYSLLFGVFTDAWRSRP